MPFENRTFRMLQMNLRDADFPLDAGKYLREARALGAEVLLFNAGGISANYPTRLPFHRRNPRLRGGDPLGGVVEGARRMGMKVVGRFDFSKVWAPLGRRHPDWLYKSLKGTPVAYNGLLQTCLNGAYQQERLFDILDEALSRYPLDGVFINMFGYFTSDYSHTYHGPCQCAACGRRFKAMHGLPLPRHEGLPAYQEFCRATASELGERLSRFLRSRHPGCASVSYDYGGADVKCNESNSDIDRALPEWNYSASDNNKRVLGSFRGMHSCNADISFAGHACRHVGASRHLNALRLAQDLACGGWPWFVVIGPTWKQADRSPLAAAREIFAFHRRHLGVLGGTASRADLALVACGGASYRGFYRALSEAQRSFDCIEEFRLAAPGLPRPLSSYAAVLVPDAAALSPASRAALDAYVDGGGRLVAAGGGGDGLACLGLRGGGKAWPKGLGRYLRIRKEDKRAFKGAFADLDLLYLNAPFWEFRPGPRSRGLLRLIPQSKFGPPEFCEPGKEAAAPGLFLSRFGRGRAAYAPYDLGGHHEPRFFSGHARLLLAMLGQKPLYLKAQSHPLLELSHRAAPDGAFEWVGLINHSGQNGSAFHAPLPLGGVILRVKPLRPPKAARLLKSGAAVRLKRLAGGWVEARLPAIGLFDFLLLEARA